MVLPAVHIGQGKVTHVDLAGRPLESRVEGRPGGRSARRKRVNW